MTIAELAPMQTQAAAGETLVRAAERIAERICAAAFWNGDKTRCNWMGRTDEEGTAQSAFNPCSAALTGHLYSGSGGVALFLAELWRVNGDRTLAHVARAAVARSVEALLRPSDLPLSPLSFWVGEVGGAWLAAHVARTGLDPDARAHVAPLLARARAAFGEKHILDVVGGTSGAIPALIALSRDDEWREDALALARLFGDEICDTAKRGEPEFAAGDNAIASGFAFDTPPLTGFSHGAAGMAYALFALHRVTGEPRYLDVARGACVYEDALFDETAGNWRDMRSFNSSLTFQTAWCHGAPGIGLTRLLAIEVDGERRTQYESQVRRAARVVLDTIPAKLAEGRADATLCHGIAGLSEILWTYAEGLDDETYRANARATALELVRRYEPAGDYPTAAPLAAANPSLAIGHAGIGLHLLRVSSGATEVLAIR